MKTWHLSHPAFDSVESFLETSSPPALEAEKRNPANANRTVSLSREVSLCNPLLIVLAKTAGPSLTRCQRKHKILACASKPQRANGMCTWVH